MSGINKVSRRTVLRGVLGGTAVAVGLPVLECFLNTSGTAYAATGAPLPPCFGTWSWGLGLTPNRWVPTTTGPDYELPDHLAVLNPIKEKMNLFSGDAGLSRRQGQSEPLLWCSGPGDGPGIEERERLHQEHRYHHRRTDRQGHEVFGRSRRPVTAIAALAGARAVRMV